MPVKTRATLALRLLRNLPLLLSTIARMLLENPAHFLVQMLRRVPPKQRARLDQQSGAARTFLGARATWQFVLDHPEAARSALSNGSKGRWANELRLNLRVPLSAEATPSQRAQQAWERGDLTEAIGIDQGSPRAGGRGRLLAGERTILDPAREMVLRGIPVESDPSGGHPRVLHFLTNSLPWTISGYSLRSQGIMSAQAERGLYVQAATRLAYPVIIGRPWAPLVEMVQGVKYHRLLPVIFPGPVDQQLAKQARELANLVQEIGPDILHTTTNYQNALTVDAVARATGLPWVYEMRGEMEKTWVARQPDGQQAAAEESERYQLMRRRETQMAKRANAVVALSQVQAVSLEERGVDPQKIWVVPNAVDEALLSVPRDPAGARQRLGLSGDFWVGSVSAMVAYEGFGVLLDAIAWCRTQGHQVRCLLVGDGVTRPALIEQAKALGIEDLVVFPGRVNPQEASLWYQALDVMVIPRLDTPVTRSVTPIKGLTAMALGIPQVVSDLPALREVSVSDGQGIAVPAQDSQALGRILLELQGDRQLRESLGQNGRKAAATRTWSVAAQTYEKLYNQLCTKGA